MFVPAAIDKDYVVHTKRRVLKRKAGLLVDRTGKRSRSASRAMPQQSMGDSCWDKRDCQVSCGYNRVCVGGSCVPIGSATYNRVCSIG
jgi:hypothetical protein